MRQHSFTILILFTVLAITGIFLYSFIGVTLKPSRTGPLLYVSYQWSEASAENIEKQVTSKLEGLFNSIKEVKQIESVSQKERGIITLLFKENASMETVRFEVSQLIRQSFNSLPEGVSYPLILNKKSDLEVSPILTYNIRSTLDNSVLAEYIDHSIKPYFFDVEGIDRIELNGINERVWVVSYNLDKIHQFNISISEITELLNFYLGQMEIGRLEISNNKNTSIEQSIILTTNQSKISKMIDMPIKKVDGTIIRLRDIANVKTKELQGDFYYRLNGTNTVTLSIYGKKKVNTLSLAKQIRPIFKELNKSLPNDINIKLEKDNSEYISREIRKIALRAFCSLLILLTIVYIINRNIKYLIIILLSLVFNLLIAINFYYIFDVELQLYSFAGITISFGLILDNTIIITDHLRKNKNLKVIRAIIAASLTTIGALTIIFFLEESQKYNLWDFALVIVINLGVSISIGLYLIPALFDKMKISYSTRLISYKGLRIKVYLTRTYSKIIFEIIKIKWIVLILIVLFVGVPINLLPEKLENDTSFGKVYNNTIGNNWIIKNIRPNMEKYLGGTLKLFTDEVLEKSYYTDTEKTQLKIRATLPDGGTIEQLNNIIKKVEKYLSSFEEIELFETKISSYKNSEINVYFKDQFDIGSFPLKLKNLVEKEIIYLGGVDWSVSGVGQGFSNSLVDYKNSRIFIEGYNYNELYINALKLKKELIFKSNGRIEEVDITTGDWWNVSSSLEYVAKLNQTSSFFGEISSSEIYRPLDEKLNSKKITISNFKGELQKVHLEDENKNSELWSLLNEPIHFNEKIFKLKEQVQINKRSSGNDIIKLNQQYQLVLAYNFIGPPILENKLKQKMIKSFNQKLPLGYRAYKFEGGWNKDDKKQYYFIIVVTLIIFFITSVLLESLIQSIAIVATIPISFIGVFLIFYLFNFNFDQGGYASFILLCGIVVNAAIYIINDFNNLKDSNPRIHESQLYFKAFNKKITPIFLTIVTTIISLIPFVWSGQKETFWFTFAIGSIGGLLFSVIALVIFLPVFILWKKSTIIS